MFQTILLFAVYVLLIASVALSLLSLWQEKHRSEKFAVLALVLAFFLLLGALTLRGAQLGRFPFTSLYEFALWFVWGTIFIFLIIRRRLHAPALTVIVALISVVAFSYIGTLSSDAVPLMPALKSPWLTAHVATSIIAYGAFAIAFCLSVLYLIKRRSENPEKPGAIPPVTRLDQLTYKCIVVGFVFQTLLLITGAIWAEAVWGGWWTWDPKETWALITWLVYAAYLHGYKSWRLQGTKAAVFSIVGFLVVMFTMFGVTFLLGGLHAY